MTIVTDYEVSGKFLTLNLQGKGPVTVDAGTYKSYMSTSQYLTQRLKKQFMYQDLMYF